MPPINSTDALDAATAATAAYQADRDAHAMLRGLFDAAIAAAQPDRCVPPHLPTRAEIGSGRLIVIGAGKASAAMARALEDHYSRHDPEILKRIEGLVITRYGYGVACSNIEILEAAHPVPDAAGLAGAQRMLELVQGLRERDLVICLISGVVRHCCRCLRPD